jgi:hypothetical protein
LKRVLTILFLLLCGVLSAAALEGDAASEAADHVHPEHALMPGVVLISDPEPDWMTPDWRYRIIIAR